MLLGIGLDQPGGGTLHRVAQLPEQLAHMSGVISQPEFFFDDVAYQGAGPNPGFQTVSHRPAV
jgi:hypothetical protein